MHYISHTDTLYLNRSDLAAYGLGEAWSNWQKGRYGVSLVLVEEELCVDFEVIPPRSRSKLPSRAEWVRKALQVQAAQSLEERGNGLAKLLGEAVTQGYKAYVNTYLKGGYDLSKSEALAKAAAVLKVGAGLKFTKNTGMRIEDYMKLVNELNLSELRFGKPVEVLEGGYKVVKWVNMNPQVAYRKMREIRAVEETTISSIVRAKRVGNTNALKKQAHVERVITYIYCCLGNGQLLASQVWERYELWRLSGGAIDYDTGEQFELPSLCPSSVAATVQRPEIRAKAALLKHGQRVFNNQFMPFVVGKRPEYMLSLVGMDDEDAPFYLSIGGKATWQRAKVVFIFDASSRQIVGYAIGLKGTFELYMEAVKSMLRGEFVAETRGVQPGEVQLDHYTKGEKSKWELMFKGVNFGRAKNPQERYAEREILEWESGYLRGEEGWLGHNITAKRYQNHRNEDMGIKRYELWEIDEMYRRLIPQFNNRVERKQPINPNLYKIPAQFLALYAGECREESIRRGFIRMSFGGQYSYYEVGEGKEEGDEYNDILAKLEHGFKVRVWFMPAFDAEGNKIAPAEIHVFNWKKKEDKFQDTYLCTCKQAAKVQRAWAEQGEEDYTALAHHRNRKEQFMAEAAAFMQELSEMNLGGMDRAEAEAILSGGYDGNKEELQKAEAVLLQPLYKEEEEDDDEFVQVAWDPKKHINDRLKRNF